MRRHPLSLWRTATEAISVSAFVALSLSRRTGHDIATSPPWRKQSIAPVEPVTHGKRVTCCLRINTTHDGAVSGRTQNPPKAEKPALPIVDGLGAAGAVFEDGQLIDPRVAEHVHRVVQIGADVPG